MWSEHRFISFDETPIFYRRCMPAAPPKAFLFIVHGIGEHGGRYKRLAEYLVDFGIAAVIPDLRGFGQSGGARGYVKHFSDYHRDLSALHSLTERKEGGRPLFFLGHSFGGIVSSSYLAFHPVKTAGLALSSPIFGIGIRVAWWRKAAGTLCSRVSPRLTLSNQVNPSALTHDKEIISEYRADPLIHHKISGGLYGALTAMFRQRQGIAEKLLCPVLLLQAGSDFIVSKNQAIHFFDELKSPDKELELYPGFFHEVLNETDRDRVFLRLALWLAKHVPAA